MLWYWFLSAHKVPCIVTMLCLITTLRQLLDSHNIHNVCNTMLSIDTTSNWNAHYSSPVFSSLYLMNTLHYWFCFYPFHCCQLPVFFNAQHHLEIFVIWCSHTLKLKFELHDQIFVPHFLYIFTSSTTLPMKERSSRETPTESNDYHCQFSNKNNFCQIEKSHLLVLLTSH